MDSLSFFHVNDIYNAEKSARFIHQWKQALKDESETKGRNCLNFFAGDAWAPSIMSTIVRGKQMVPVLNVREYVCRISFRVLDNDQEMCHASGTFYSNIPRLSFSISNKFPSLVFYVLLVPAVYNCMYRP